MKESFYSWGEYSFLFKQKAQDFNVSPSIILELLNYSENLYNKKLPIIYDLKHLSYLTGFKEEYIKRAITGSGSFYRSFQIAKKNGKSRTITEPLPGLKEIQYWILNNILKKIEPNKLNNAYSTGKSIVTNAKYHTKQNIVLNMDIEKYFDNIKYAYVYEFFLSIGYNQQVSTTLSKLVSLNDGLPQGSPTSPQLSSILTKHIDVELFEYCLASKLRYSRYADDITISGDFAIGSVVAAVSTTLEKHGYTINKMKTTAKLQHQRQMVTGVVVNKKLSIKKSCIKNLRQQVYYIDKFGLENHLKRTKEIRRNHLFHLLGKVNHYLSVRKTDKELIKIKEKLKYLASKSNIY